MMQQTNTAEIQDLKDHLNKIERKIAALQNNELNKLEKMIREVHCAE